MNDFFGLDVPNQWRSYLEWGFENETASERRILKHIYDEDAYDLWHLGVRYKELLECRRLAQSDSIQLADLPRKEKFLIFYLLLAGYPEVTDVAELGCSVLELIDGLELMRKYFEASDSTDLAVDVKNLRFSGIDISDLMRRAAVDSHNGYNVEVYEDASRFWDSKKAAKSSLSALFDLNVSSYAFPTSKALADFLNLFEVAYVRLSLTQGDTIVATVGSKSYVCFSLEELVTYLDRPLFFLCEQRTNNEPWINRWTDSNHWSDLSLNRPGETAFFVCGEASRVRDAVTNARKLKDVDVYFTERNVNLIEVSDLLQRSLVDWTYSEGRWTKTA